MDKFILKGISLKRYREKIQKRVGDIEFNITLAIS